jgi:hypothetical protein
MRAPFNGKRVGARGEKRQNPAAECCATGTDLSVWTCKGRNANLAHLSTGTGHQGCPYLLRALITERNEVLRYGQAEDISREFCPFFENCPLWTSNAVGGDSPLQNLCITLGKQQVTQNR